MTIEPKKSAFYSFFFSMKNVEHAFFFKKNSVFKDFVVGPLIWYDIFINLV